MFDRFFPDIYVDDIYSIDFESLKALGYKNLLFDLDNTIAPFDVEEPNQKMIDFFDNLKKEKFNVFILSNNGKERVETFCKKLKVKYMYKAGKPKTTKIKKAMQKRNMKSCETAMIGDQLFTDMWFGTRLSFKKILVKPIANRDEFTVKLKRGLEKEVFKIYLKKNN